MPRLDRILQQRYPDFTRSRLEGLVKAGFVRVNGATAPKAGMKVSDDDEIEVEIPPPVPAVPEPENIEIDIVYEDDDLIVVNKAPGMVVHPAPGHFSGTLVNALLGHCPQLAGIGGVARPGIVHRLDMDTSGLLVAAKTETAMQRLAAAFATHDRVEKVYCAICRGAPPLRSGHLETRIGRHPVDRKRMAVLDSGGKLAITDYETLDAHTVGGLSVVRCRIATGRTHQIRVHLAHLGCPVAGDAVYGKPALDRRLSPPPQRQLLHAWRLRLRHPATGAELAFTAPLPADMRQFWIDAP